MARICIAVPVYNEEKELESSIEMVLRIADKMFKNFEIVIGDNASTDRTLEIAKELSKKYNKVDYIHLKEKGRGRALRKIWSESKADIMCYTDVDLSTDLSHLKELVSTVQAGYDIAIGSRLLEKSKIQRKFIREILSRGYNFLLKIILNIQISDAQCGFKAVNKKVVKNLLPLVENNEWFFDTELLVLGNKLGYKIKEIPVKWIESADSKVNIFDTIISYIKNIFWLKKKLKKMDEKI